MDRYAFFADGNQLWRDLAEALASSGYEPAIWLGHPRHLGWVRERFPACKVFDERALNHGDYDRGSATPLPFEIRRSGHFAQIERAAVYALQRNARYRSIGYLERRDFCGAMSNFLWTEIQNSKVGAFIAAQAPHSATGLLFAGLLEAAGLEMLHFDPVPIAPRIVPRRGFDFQSISLDLLDRPTEPEFDSDLDFWIETFVARLKQKELAYSEERNSRFEDRMIGPIGALRTIKYTRAELRDILHGYAQSSVHPAPPDVHRPTLRATLSASRHQRRSLAHLRRELNEHSRGDLGGESFWLFLLHFEPEKTTLPNGDLLGDQLYLVQQAASHLPRGTKLYVKEHPSQLLSTMNGHVGRPPNFYSELSAIPEVQIVPPSSDLFTLMKNAQMILTVTGTVGVEGLLLGKSVVHFGHPWYGDLVGTCSFQTLVSDRGSSALPSGRASQSVVDENIREQEAKEKLKEFLVKYSVAGTISPGDTRYFLEQGWIETYDLASIVEICHQHFESNARRSKA